MPAARRRHDVRDGDPDSNRTVAGCVPNRRNRPRPGMGAPAGRDARPSFPSCRSGPETDASSGRCGTAAAVVVWNAEATIDRSSCPRLVRIDAREAIGALAAWLETRGVWSISRRRPDGGSCERRPVVVALASEIDRPRLQPLLAAGIRRADGDDAGGGARFAGAAAPRLLDAGRTGSVRRARRTGDLHRAHARRRADRGPRSRVGICRRVRLGPRAAGPRGHRRRGSWRAISDFGAATGGAPGDIKHVCVCGGHPELRSMTAPLMEQLDIEFEPLDSLFGIDAARLPEPADEFRERGAELRLAWAAAADSPPTINLLRARNRQASKTHAGARRGRGRRGRRVGGRLASRRVGGGGAPTVRAGARDAHRCAAAGEHRAPYDAPPGRATGAADAAGQTSPPAVTTAPGRGRTTPVRETPAPMQRASDCPAAAVATDRGKRQPEIPACQLRSRCVEATTGALFARSASSRSSIGRTIVRRLG